MPDEIGHRSVGWLACVDWGTALAPIYMAHDAGLPVHVWVDETRPRNQGANLTSWEFMQEGVPHKVIADNAGGFYMRRGEVDLCITGADRIAANGDVANKIGTYQKAVLAKENGIPFYVAAPSSTIDLKCRSGLEQVENWIKRRHILQTAVPIYVDCRRNRRFNRVFGNGADQAASV